MADDDTPLLALDGNFDEVRPAGPIARFFGYLSSVTMIAAGPALVIVLHLVGELQWQGVVGGIAIVCTAGLLGLMQAVSIARQRRRAVRLASNGRRAVARVTGSRSRSLGEEDGVELSLMIEGPGVPAFSTTRREPAGRARDVGDAFEVLVDPDNGVYRVL